MALEVKMYSNEVPLTMRINSDNASSILSAIKEEYFASTQNKTSQEIGKEMATTKPGTLDFLNKSQRVDLMTMSEDDLKKLSIEPKIDVILKERMQSPQPSYAAQGGRRKSRKSRKSRRRR